MPDAATNIDQEQHSNYAVFYRLLQRVASIEIPLAADPDYLVVGPFNRGWGLYDPVLATGAFRLIQTYGRYDVYERVR